MAANLIANVRRLRTERGWSAATLSSAISDLGVPMTRSLLANIEAGRRGYISVDELMAFAVALEVTAVDLLSDEHHELDFWVSPPGRLTRVGDPAVDKVVDAVEELRQTVLFRQARQKNRQKGN